MAAGDAPALGRDTGGAGLRCGGGLLCRGGQLAAGGESGASGAGAIRGEAAAAGSLAATQARWNGSFGERAIPLARARNEHNCCGRTIDVDATADMAASENLSSKPHLYSTRHAAPGRATRYCGAARGCARSSVQASGAAL